MLVTMWRGGPVARRRRTRGGFPGLALTAALAVGLAAGLVACGSAPPKIGPTGVDELTVPTPSPDAGDFVPQVDNPWLPLTPGTRQAYLATGGDSPDRQVTLSVLEEPGEVAGIATTVVRREESVVGGPVVLVTEASYAQDVDGNVWLFGERTISARRGSGPPTWLAGTQGAEAALAMPAAPRLGDGFATAFAPGVVEDRARVLSVSDSVATASTHYEGAVLLAITSGVDPTVDERQWFAQGLGLVRQADAQGRVLELVPES
jgi:hypothetical protein